MIVDLSAAAIPSIPEGLFASAQGQNSGSAARSRIRGAWQRCEMLFSLPMDMCVVQAGDDWLLLCTSWCVLRMIVKVLLVCVTILFFHCSPLVILSYALKNKFLSLCGAYCVGSWRFWQICFLFCIFLKMHCFLDCILEDKHWTFTFPIILLFLVFCISCHIHYVWIRVCGLWIKRLASFAIQIWTVFYRVKLGIYMGNLGINCLYLSILFLISFTVFLLIKGSTPYHWGSNHFAFQLLQAPSV